MTRVFYLFLISITVACNPNQNSTIEPQEKTVKSSLSTETEALYNNLKNVAQNHIIFGHQDALAYGIGWKGTPEYFESDVYKISGDHPAIFGWDIGHIDSTMNIDSVPFDHMKSWIIEAYLKGGINTMGWHEINLLTKESSWDNTRVVDQILPGGNLHLDYLAQLDKVADLLSALKTSDGISVPIIFRPFHEHNGSWFWWGAETCSDEEYKQLWQFTYHYLTVEKALNNILFCYSTDAFTGRDEYLQRYPGDDYVDILGFDDYKSVKTTETRQVLIDRLTVVNELATEKDKVAVLAETGFETLSKENWWTSIILDGFKATPKTDRIAYMLIWRNAWKTHHYAPYPNHPSTPDFIEFKQDSSILFLSDLPEMYQ